MDVEKLRKRVARRNDNEILKQRIRQQIRDYDYGLQESPVERKELFEPITTSQQKVKEAVDKKQDKVIKKLQESQEAMVQSVDTLSGIMSKHGSIPGASDCLSDLPSIGPLDTIEEDSAEGAEGVEGAEGGEGVEGEKGKKGKKGKKSAPNAFEREVLKKHGLNPDMTNPPPVEIIRSVIRQLNGKASTNNEVIQTLAKKRASCRVQIP